MDGLLVHPGFYLVYVDDNGGMSMKTPLDGCDDISGKGYRCISHLWGNSTKWANHPVENIPWSVDLREEKREKLLQIFRHYKGYWWIDVFCIDQSSDNKPLSIMGDVYRNCVECICLLDIKIPGILHWHYGPFPKNSIKVLYDHIFELIGCEWNKRVWTLQEWCLPQKVLYTEETIEKDFTMIDPSSLGDLSDRMEGTCSNLYLFLYSVTKFRYIAPLMYLTNREYGGINIVHLISSGRKCKNLEDYYYGIAGIAGVPLKDGLSFLEAEKEFLSYINDNNKWSDILITRTKPVNEKYGVYKSWNVKTDSALLDFVIPWIF